MIDQDTDGGPAFPRTLDAHYDACNDIVVPQVGMSLRDWFAGHAPVKIDEWFLGLDRFKEPKSLDPHGFCPSCCAGGNCDESARCKNEHAMHQLKDDHLATRPMRWRWAYADAMLAVRAKGGDQ